jgi:heme oxygenase
LQTARIPETPKLHAQLRDATRALHDRVEEAVGLPASVGDVEDYRRVLARFWGFHEPLETALAEVAWGGFDFERRRRAAWAAADLQALGLSTEAIARLPRRPATRPSSVEEAWGVLYVLEGSTLGGRVIRRALQPVIGPELARACRFFDGRGAEGGALWRAFLAALEAGVATEGGRSAAQKGAEGAFRDMIDWFGSA